MQTTEVCHGGGRRAPSLHKILGGTGLPLSEYMEPELERNCYKHYKQHCLLLPEEQEEEKLTRLQN